MILFVCTRFDRVYFWFFYRIFCVCVCVCHNWHSKLRRSSWHIRFLPKIVMEFICIIGLWRNSDESLLLYVNALNVLNNWLFVLVLNELLTLCRSSCNPVRINIYLRFWIWWSYESWKLSTAFWFSGENSSRSNKMFSTHS